MDEHDIFQERLSSSRKEISESGEWLKDKIKNMRNPLRVFDQSAYPSVGNMYLFTYDPKYKETLPFYDMYPLVFPVEFYANGFLGINLHYLPPAARVSLLSGLTKVASDNKYNDKTKLNISYELVSRYSRQFAGIESCIKRYLFSHVRSQFHKVSSSDWEKAVMLPLQRWKVNNNKKYASSPPY